jgi:transcriptional regulator with XRE-family HTH domain
MSFTGPDIRNLRQRLGWSVAEMARQMGCSTNLIQIWENGVQAPDFEALNQLRYLRNQVDMTSDHIAQKPQVENEMEKRRVGQLTHRDLLKDN